MAADIASNERLCSALLSIRGCMSAVGEDWSTTSSPTARPSASLRSPTVSFSCAAY